MIRSVVSYCIYSPGYFAGPVIVDSRKYINEAIVKNDYTIQLRLTIRDLKPQDFTTYRCTAKNSLGEVDGAIKLYGKAD